MFRFEPVRRVFVFAWLFLSFAERSTADPCAELGRAIDALIPAVRSSGKQIDQALQRSRSCRRHQCVCRCGGKASKSDTTSAAPVAKATCRGTGSLQRSEPAARSFSTGD